MIKYRTMSAQLWEQRMRDARFYQRDCNGRPLWSAW